MKATDFHQYRQGDVLIERIVNIPTTVTLQNKSTRIILAHGEVTGHHHALEVADPAGWWKAGAISISNQKPTTLAGDLFAALPSGGVVTHPEHSAIRLPVGNYRITRQREYAPDAIRNVED